MNHLTRDQQNAMAIYTAQYTQINSHIDLLHSMLDTVRNNMDDIIYASTASSRSSSRRVYSPPSYRRTSRPRPSRTPLTPTTTPTTATHIPLTTLPNYNYNFSYEQPSYTYLTGNMNSSSSSSSSDAIANDIGAFVSNFLNTTIVVRPTPEQIERSSRLIRYGNIVNPISDSCPISLERFTNDDEVRQLHHCGHIFHTHQFQTWFSSNVRCPVCRHDIRAYQTLEQREQREQREQEIEAERQRIYYEQSGAEEEKVLREEAQQRLRDEATQAEERHQQQQAPPPVITNNLDSLVREMFTALLNPNNATTNIQANNERFMFDPSNNMVYFETFIRPNDTNNNGTGPNI